ncbi:MAG: pentapeptide repeat-containing protein [Acidimicrobiales bacterium]
MPMFRPRRQVAVASVAGASVVGALLLVVSASVTPTRATAGGHVATAAARAEAPGATGVPLGGLDSVFPGDRPTVSNSRTDDCPDRGQLVDHGGPVQTEPRVYVDFWGWTSDPDGERPYLIEFLSSVGRTRWLSTLAQYCAGDDPRLGGQWSDPSDRPPRHPGDARIQQEGRAAARHFGITAPAGSDDQNVQIIVALPPGVILPSADSQDCAYHEQLGIRGAGRSPVLTVLPYLPVRPFGGQCGAFSVNAGAGGALDGVSITEGHELAESITDPEADGWFGDGDPRGEIADQCQSDEDYDIGADGHTFAVQELWSNAAGGCVVMAAPPGVPTDVRAVGVDNHIDVSWSPPVHGGGTPITAWTVTANPGMSSCTESGRDACTLPGLVDGTTYSVTVRAVNAAGMGVESEKVPATPSSNQNCRYVGPYADLQRCSLSSSAITGSDLTGADLAGADLRSADLSGADLRDADLAGADLSGATVTGTDLFGADLSGATLAGAILRDCNLSAVDLTGTDLSGSTMQDDSSSGITGTPRRLPVDWSLVEGYLVGPGADLDEADLSFADLTGADLTGADLTGADLISADVSHADLSGANLEGADVSDADLRGVDVSDADLADLAGVFPYEFLCPVRAFNHDAAYWCGTDIRP